MCIREEGVYLHKRATPPSFTHPNSLLNCPADSAWEIRCCYLLTLFPTFLSLRNTQAPLILVLCFLLLDEACALELN